VAYTFSDIVSAYKALGIRKGDLVYVVTELWRLRNFAGGADADAICGAHYGALRQVVGDAGTIAVSTASVNICNTEIPFDPATTPAYNTGVLSEYVRQLPGTRRSFHPFVSYAANGPLADAITANVSRHAYGPESPEARLIENGAKFVTIGMSPGPACSTVHHVEQVMGVPFRYVKEFSHPVVRDGKIARELFYMHVWYRDTGMVKDRGGKMFEQLTGRYGFEVKSTTLGRGRMWSYDMAAYYPLACRVFADDIYTQCDVLPQVRPYTK